MFEPRKNNIPGQRADEPQALRPDDVEIEHLRDCLADALERAANDGTDVSEIQKCLQKLQETAETPIPVDVEDKFRQFQEKHAELLRDDDGGSAAPDDRHRRRRKWTWIGLIAAVVALLSIMFMAGASDFDIRGMIARHTDEEFFFTGDKNLSDSQTTIESYNSLESALDAYEIKEAVVPQWIPARFELETVIAQTIEERYIYIRAEYKNSSTNKYCNIEVKKYFDFANTQARYFEKDSSPVMKYESRGITHYLFDNPAGAVVTWLDGNLLCSISGDLTAEEFQKITDSMYGGILK